MEVEEHSTITCDGIMERTTKTIIGKNHKETIRPSFEIVGKCRRGKYAFIVYCLLERHIKSFPLSELTPPKRTYWKTRTQKDCYQSKLEVATTGYNIQIINIQTKEEKWIKMTPAEGESMRGDEYVKKAILTFPEFFSLKLRRNVLSPAAANPELQHLEWFSW